jgi:hypothetical protein
VEGCHAQLKAFLKKSMSDMKGVYERFHHFWVAQQSNIEVETERERVRTRHNVNRPIFAEIQGRVHHTALKRLVDELAKLGAKDNALPDGEMPVALNGSCKCRIRSSIGLHCFYELWGLLERVRWYRWIWYILTGTTIAQKSVLP